MIKSIKLMGRTWTVSPNRDIAIDDNNKGQFWDRKCEILIDPTWVPQAQGEILIHEVLEALNFTLRLEMEHANITRLSNGFFAVLRDNPQLMKHIASGSRIVSEQGGRECKK